MDAGGGGRRIGRRSFPVVSLAVAALLAACGESSADGGVVTEPLPSSMCPQGSAPEVVAYEFDGDGVEWVSCTDALGYRSLLPVADGVVYVATYNAGAVGELTALDAATGEPIADAPPPPPQRGTVEGQPYTGQPARVEVGDITVIGGQDDEVRAISGDGTELWSQTGVWTYDDVWAIDDGAVFAVERVESPLGVARLAAYEVETGDVRWSYEGDPYREGLWPFHAVNGRLYTLWSNLQVRSTADGELLWHTDYPAADPADEMPATGLRMSGVDTDGTNVYVSFATEASAGD
jgi:outer membrane protein assembly factor BamB